MHQPISSPPSASPLPSPPTAMTPEMDRFTGVFMNRLEDHPTDFRRRRIRAGQAPAGEARAWLEARRDELRASLIPTPGPDLNGAVMLLLSRGREFGTLTEKAAGLRVALYVEALSDIPTWAVKRARLIFAKGGWRCLWDGREVPSSHDVVSECRHLLLPIETELRRLEAVLDAEPYTSGADEDERAVAAGRWWDEVRPEMQREPGISQRTDDELAAEATAMAQVNERFRERDRAMAAAQGRGTATWGRLPISDELARQIGLRVPAPIQDKGENHEAR